MPRASRAPVVDIPLPILTKPQAVLFEATERCVNAEGSIRSGKTTIVLLKLWRYALTHPGIKILAARWKQEEAEGQLRGEAWRNVAAFLPRRGPTRLGRHRAGVCLSERFFLLRSRPEGG
jgi:hypothetical protein